MSKQLFVVKDFRAGSLALIDKANEILGEYEGQGLVLTLRQLYYQFVARGLLPNKQSEYKRLGVIISDARLAGLVDWDMMEDRTRYMRTLSSWGSPEDIIDVCARQYREDVWLKQPFRPEVWIEKDALVGVIERACNDLRVSHFACRGYASQSSQYEAGKRLAAYARQGQRPIILHLGDHDPSGIDMTRDNADRIGMFAGRRVEVRRLALNMNQVEEHQPPPNPAKESDVRFASYVQSYGEESWELDALDPAIIDRLIRDEINGMIDRPKWDAAMSREKVNRERIGLVSSNWDAVVDFVEAENGDN